MDLLENSNLNLKHSFSLHRFLLKEKKNRNNPFPSKHTVMAYELAASIWTQKALYLHKSLYILCGCVHVSQLEQEKPVEMPIKNGCSSDGAIFLFYGL